MFSFRIDDLYGGSYNINLVRGFRILHSYPKCWKEILTCATQHGMYESGITRIYQSTNTKKFYIVRYFDGCFNEMYSETIGVDWNAVKRGVDECKNREEINKVLKAFLG